MNERDTKTAFAAAIKSCRSRLGISQEVLAERADLHRTYISDIERGVRNPSLGSISRLALALDVSVSDLFTDANALQRKQGQLKTGQEGRELVNILLVEDSPNDVEMTLEAFKTARFANMVNVVRDGAEALDYIFCEGAYSRRRPKDQPHVVLLDLNLPKVSGLEVLRRLKMDKRTSFIPIIVLTASQTDRDIEECNRLGARTYLVKPVDFQRLSRVTPELHLDWALFKPAPNGNA
jgi:two-component system, response regulator